MKVTAWLRLAAVRTPSKQSPDPVIIRPFRSTHWPPSFYFAAPSADSSCIFRSFRTPQPLNGLGILLRSDEVVQCASMVVSVN